MDDFGTLARDFGFKPQGKSAPMKSDGGGYRSRPPSFAADEDQAFNDVFASSVKFTSSNPSSTMSDIDYDSIFKNSAFANNNNEVKNKSGFSSVPVYDDDIFEGLPGMKSKSMYSGSGRFDDNVFASVAGSPSDDFDNLLGNLGWKEKVELPKQKTVRSPRGLDDLHISSS